MSDFSLRLPYLIYLSIGSLLVGVLVAPWFRDIPAAEVPVPQPTSAHDHMHRSLEVSGDQVPEIEMTVQEDSVSGWNIALSVENFTFTPETVNGANVPNTGHAHLYVNGQKVARLYSTHFHLPALPPGQHEITVALNSNDHSFYAVDGVQIEARTIAFESEPSPAPG